MILLALVACDGEKGSGDALVGVAGTISASGMDGSSDEVSATAETLAAYGVNVNGELALLLSASADATCADAATYLEGGGSDWNPGTITPAGTCSVYVRAAYEGSLDVTDDPVAATVAVNCAMGEGEWVEDSEDVDAGYAYSGAWWIGSPDGFTLSVEGGDEADYTVSLTMESYTGSFTYDTENPDPDPASGAVSGTATAAWCPDMGPGLAR